MMKLALRVLLFAILVLCTQMPGPATTPPAAAFPNLQHDPLFDQATYQKLRDITVNVSWNQADLGTVLRDLTLMVRKTHPVRAEINFRLSSSATPADRQRKVSLVLQGAPVYQVLEYLSQQASFDIKVHADLVLVMPGTTR
jgi:hypothetical protein